MTDIIDLIATEEIALVTGVGGGSATITFGGGTVSFSSPVSDGFTGAVGFLIGSSAYEDRTIEKVVWRLSSVSTSAGYDWDATSTSDGSVGIIPGSNWPTPLDTPVAIAGSVISTGDREIVMAGTFLAVPGLWLLGLGPDTGVDTDSGFVISKFELHLVSEDSDLFWAVRRGALEIDL